MRYTQEQISTALVLLKATGSPDKVIQTLGYPSSPMLYHWRKKYPEYYDVPNQKHWRQAPNELKHNVIKRCLIKGEPVKLVAEEIGYTPSLIYKWIREYREKGCFQPMKKTTANINVNPNDITSAEDINELKAQMLDMQMEIDILKEMFFASTFWTKLQNIFGHYCKSKLDKVAKPRLAAILPAA